MKNIEVTFDIIQNGVTKVFSVRDDFPTDDKEMVERLLSEKQPEFDPEEHYGYEVVAAEDLKVTVAARWTVNKEYEGDVEVDADDILAHGVREAVRITVTDPEWIRYYQPDARVVDVLVTFTRREEED